MPVTYSIFKKIQSLNWTVNEYCQYFDQFRHHFFWNCFMQIAVNEVDVKVFSMETNINPAKNLHQSVHGFWLNQIRQTNSITCIVTNNLCQNEALIFLPSQTCNCQFALIMKPLNRWFYEIKDKPFELTNSEKKNCLVQ